MTCRGVAGTLGNLYREAIGVYSRSLVAGILKDGT